MLSRAHVKRADGCTNTDRHHELVERSLYRQCPLGAPTAIAEEGGPEMSRPRDKVMRTSRISGAREAPGVDGQLPDSPPRVAVIGEPRRPPSRPLCPSSRCRDGALLLGIVGSDGVVGYVRPPLRVGAEFVEAAEHQARTPEHRFRFAAPCLEKGCAHWSGTRCGVIDQAEAASTATAADKYADSSLPDCDLRPSCRWFEQIGVRACSVCPQIFNFLGRDAAEEQESQSP